DGLLSVDDRGSGRSQRHANAPPLAGHGGAKWNNSARREDVSALTRGSGGAVLREASTDLVDLRHRDREAVALRRVLREEVLVVLLAVPERAEGLDRRDDRALDVAERCVPQT